jgi:protease-4
MKEFFRTFLAVILAQIVLGLWGFLLVIIFLGMALSKTVTVPRDAYLVQTIGGEIPEYAPPMSMALFDDDRPHHTAILENLEKARVDNRIRGVILGVGMSDLGVGKREEIRQRVRQLRDAGKGVYAFGRYLTVMDYFMIGGCDSIISPPEGVLEFRGIAARAPFFKGALDALGIKANLHRIAEYKSAAEPFLRENMSDESRENAGWIVEAVFDNLVSTIAEDRDMSADKVLELMERALFNPSDALEAGLLDAVLFWEDLEDTLSRGNRWRTISGEEYAKIGRKEVGLSGASRIAVVHAQGVIGGGDNGYTFPFGLKMGSAAMMRVLQDVRENRAIDAVVIRVDSPGGISTASDEIGNSVERLASQKPTVISMVDMAASGGYMMSYRCSTIVALPHTLTGSIGSITGKFNFRGLYSHLGVTKDFVPAGPHALLQSDYSDYTEEEWDIVRSRHQASYESWVNQVSEFRQLEMSALDSLARGRVWTGQQAMERRLVDHVGGIDKALLLAKQQAGIPEDDDVQIVHLPKSRPFLERLLEDGRLLSTSLRQLVGLALGALAGDRGPPTDSGWEIADPEMFHGVWLWRIQ